MSLTGKILLFVNLLAAAGLTYLAAQDWAKRQELNGLVVRYLLALDGVPVAEPKGVEADSDAVPMAVETGPGATTTAVSKKLLDAHFGGQAPRTQLDEVKAVQQKIRSAVAGFADDPSKLRFLCGGLNQARQYEPGLLIRFADSFEERQAIRALGLTRNPQQVTANLTEAYRRLDRKFEAVIGDPKPAQAQADAQKLAELQGRLAANPNDRQAADELAAVYAEGAPAYTRDDADRRNRIAQLLMLHNLDAANQKRTILVTGLRVYVRALNEQLARMEEVVRRIERQMEQDQSQFQEEYELLKRLAVEQDQLLFQQQRVLAGLKDQAADDEKAVNVRQTQLTALDTELKAVADQVARLLQDQTGVEKALFDVQKKVGETLRDNIEKEARLLKAEEAKEGK